MILVDSSVWVDHFRKTNEALSAVLATGSVLVHPLVMGELALGNLAHRTAILQLLSDMPQAVMATPSEMLAFIERHALYGKGVGYVDVHLLASAKLSAARLWTYDKRLQSVAEGMKLAYRGAA